MEPPPSDELIASIEEELGGYRLPAAYVDLARGHNGGMVRRCCHPLPDDAYLMITGLYAIGRTADYSLCGPLGSTFMLREWGYPPIGVGIADTPSAGHELIMLDYRACGRRGEPRVVHVDQEADYRVTAVAPDFATFVDGLVPEDEFDTAEEDRLEALTTVERGSLSPIVSRALAASRLPDGERALRALGRRIVDEKGYFSLHADESSLLMYRLLFWLYSHLTTASSFEDFLRYDRDRPSYDLPCYELMIVFSLVAEPYGFSTDGFAEGFIRDWWDDEVTSGAIVAVADGYRLTPVAEEQLLHRLSFVVA
ncbi:SMI1/KNR4 family protein [Actinophytocola algeriensis]|uniref:SMI1/KNR4 family protein n=1 Tax=Actinophytocola algeriensis TaxID=1768010 RepID=UPI00298EEA7B|nr:SMI1/KNR4 family protein [Actinophytocola algeriensis]